MSRLTTTETTATATPNDKKGKSEAVATMVTRFANSCTNTAQSKTLTRAATRLEAWASVLQERGIPEEGALGEQCREQALNIRKARALLESVGEFFSELPPAFNPSRPKRSAKVSYNVGDWVAFNEKGKKANEDLIDVNLVMEVVAVRGKNELKLRCEAEEAVILLTVKTNEVSRKDEVSRTD